MATSYYSPSGVCKLPGCNRPRYKEPYGFTHDFCGRTHAQLYKSTYETSSYAPRKPDVSKGVPSSLSSSRKPLKATYSLSMPSSYSNPSSKTINFYNRNEPYFEFTNFHQASVNIDGKTWPTTEHYFQAQKFVGTPYVEVIRNLPAPREAFQMSRDPKVSRWRRSDWDSVKDDVMRKAVRCKFDQHKNLRKMLLDTGSKTLVEHTHNDSYWGDGGDGKGLNKLGKLLMEVRSEMATKYGAPGSNTKANDRFNNLLSSVGSSDVSRTVKGLASPMTSRKTHKSSSQSASEKSVSPKSSENTRLSLPPHLLTTTTAFKPTLPRYSTHSEHHSYTRRPSPTSNNSPSTSAHHSKSPPLHVQSTTTNSSSFPTNGLDPYSKYTPTRQYGTSQDRKFPRDDTGVYSRSLSTSPVNGMLRRSLSSSNLRGSVSDSTPLTKSNGTTTDATRHQQVSDKGHETPPKSSARSKRLLLKRSRSLTNIQMRSTDAGTSHKRPPPSSPPREKKKGKSTTVKVQQKITQYFPPTSSSKPSSVNTGQRKTANSSSVPYNILTGK